MASVDVIELGSSDDEASPTPPRAAVPAKGKAGPKLNAMVHIPKNMRGVTIKPTKSSLVKTGIPIPVRGLGNIPTSNFRSASNLNNQVTIKPLPGNKQSNSSKKAVKNTVPLPVTKPIIGNKALSLNPLSVMRNLDKSQIVINKVKTSPATNIASIRIPINLQKLVKKPVGVPKLSPGVTITKTQGGIKRPMISNVTSLKKKQKINSPPKVIPIAPKVSKPNVKKVIQTVGSSTLTVNPMSTAANVLTVELDEEADSATTNSNPAWYIRPEEQTNEEAKELEKQNNSEPEPPKYIEITIEDSPVSKLKSRRASELDNAITIDDSPVRHKTPKKTAADSDSDGSQNKHKTPKKRKKLEYPVEVPILEKSIEIEIDPIQINTVDDGVQNDGKVDEVNVPTPTTTKYMNIDRVNESVIEIIESPVKKKKIGPSNESNKSHTIQKLAQSCDSNKPHTKPKLAPSSESSRTHTKPRLTPSSDSSRTHTKLKLSPSDPDKTHTKQKFQENPKNTEPEIVVVEGEFHPVYQKYIDLCLELDSSNDMKIIVEKKIKGYYKQVPKEYTESEEFTDMVSSKMMAMKADKGKMYLYIKDIVDELNVQRKIAKNEQLKKETEKKESGKLTFTDDSEFDSKRQRQIRKLEKTIRKLHRAIQKLEEQEVDFDDEDDSVYLLTERYKERMVRVHAKLCQLTNTKLPSEPRLHIESRPGKPTGPAKRLEKWINKKVPIGTPLPFPDFHDVLRIVREANSEDKLCWNEADIMEEARDLFTRCGKKLQRRRQEIEWRIAASRLPPEEDPAEGNDDLKSKLERNRLIASKKEIDVVNKYAERQSEMKLVGEEIGDKEAEESPVESEDDDVTEEPSALKDKEKRKERLKRLIQEKSQRKSREATVDSQNIEDKTSEKSLEVNEDSQTSQEPEIILDESADAHINEDKDPLASTEVTDVLATDIADQSKSTYVADQPKSTDVADQPKSTDDADQPKSTDAKQSKSQPDKIDDAEMKEKKTSGSEKKDAKNDSEVEINSVDDGSEVDELQLLEKLYSQSDNSSSGNSSESDSPIDISDSGESDGNRNKETGIISIENSTESDTQDSKSKDESKDVCEVIEEIDSSQDALEYDVIEKGVENSDAIHVDLQKHNKDETNDESKMITSESVTDDKIDSESKDGSKAVVCEIIEEKEVDDVGDAVLVDSQNLDRDANNDESKINTAKPVTDDKIETQEHSMEVEDCNSEDSGTQKVVKGVVSGNCSIHMDSESHVNNDEKDDVHKKTASDSTPNDAKENERDVGSDFINVASQNHDENEVYNDDNNITESDYLNQIEEHAMDVDDCDPQNSTKNDEESLQHALESIESVLGSPIKDNIKEADSAHKEQNSMNTEVINVPGISESDSAVHNGYTAISEGISQGSIETNGLHSKKTENDAHSKKDNVAADLVDEKMQNIAEVSDLSSEKKCIEDNLPDTITGV